MSIRRAVAWLLDVGNQSEVDAGPAGVRREDTRPHEILEPHLYGQAEAIRVLYQTPPRPERPPKPPRAKKVRGAWIARYVGSLSSPLSGPAGSEA